MQIAQLKHRIVLVVVAAVGAAAVGVDSGGSGRCAVEPEAHLVRLAKLLQLLLMVLIRIEHSMLAGNNVVRSSIQRVLQLADHALVGRVHRRRSAQIE